MNLYLTEAERRVAEMVWQKQSLPSGELVSRCAQEMGWKRSTTYTILKRLCDRGLFQNQGGTVTSCVSRQEFYARQSEKFVDETFGGSLPAFLAAFGSCKKLSQSEIDEAQKLIDAMRG